MNERLLKALILLTFFGALAFIFIPVFSGNLIIHDDIDIAIPEDRSLPIGPGSMQFRNHDTGDFCVEVPKR